MALFGGSRDISLFNTLNKELINDIIQTEVGYYKLLLKEQQLMFMESLWVKYIMNL
jgi:hypothetical protein